MKSTISASLEEMARKKQKSHVFFIIIGLLVIAGIGILFVKVRANQSIPVQKVASQATDADLILYAQKITDGWNIPDLQYTVRIAKKIPPYARVVVTPTNKMLDPLTIIFEQKNGTWAYVNMGTAFSDLEQKIPELFREP